MNSTCFIEREKCPVCDSEAFNTIYQKAFSEAPIKDYLDHFYSEQGKVEFEYLEGADYILSECRNCYLVFQKQIANDILMEKIYEEWIHPEYAYQHHRQKDVTPFEIEIAQVARFLKKEFGDMRLFDFGMGWGEWAITAKNLGCHVLGAELSEARIKNAQANHIPILEWEDIPKHQFDFIHTEQVFEHIPNPFETLMHLKQALAPEGLIKISVPTAADIKRRLFVGDWQAPAGQRNSLNAVAPLEHINCYHYESLLHLAKRAGLREMPIPLLTQYRYLFHAKSLKQFGKNLLFPMMRNLLKSQNCLFFKHA